MRAAPRCSNGVYTLLAIGRICDDCASFIQAAVRVTRRASTKEVVWVRYVGPICPSASSKGTNISGHHSGSSEHTAYFSPILTHVFEVNILTEEFTVWIVKHDPTENTKAHPEHLAVLASESRSCECSAASSESPPRYESKLGVILAGCADLYLSYVAGSKIFHLLLSGVKHIGCPGVVWLNSRILVEILSSDFGSVIFLNRDEPSDNSTDHRQCEQTSTHAVA